MSYTVNKHNRLTNFNQDNCYCTPCKFQGRNKSDYNRHTQSQRHIANT